jgi:hypothetical protein
MSNASKLIEDLSHVPNIIAGLGMGIAEAQHHLNLVYLQSLERIIAMSQAMLGGQTAAPQPGGGGRPGGGSQELSADAQKRLETFQGFIKEMLITLAPARYQFTETTLTVKLDLAQSLDAQFGAGVSAGIGGVAVNASLSVGYGYDYRAAAECKTVLQAVPIDATTMRTLVDRAKEISANDKSTLPKTTNVEQGVQDQTGKIFERLVGAKPADIATADTTAAATTAAAPVAAATTK